MTVKDLSISALSYSVGIATYVIVLLIKGASPVLYFVILALLLVAIIHIILGLHVGYKMRSLEGYLDLYPNVMEPLLDINSMKENCYIRGHEVLDIFNKYMPERESVYHINKLIQLKLLKTKQDAS